MHINRERLSNIFTRLCEIESPSRKEGNIANYLHEIFSGIGADNIHIDESASETGSETGNMVVRFDGDAEIGAPLFFACHMDTVGPTEGIKVIREGNIFKSAGDTILGSDDKSGIAVLIEMIHILKENGTPHSPMELLFTTCEEIGLLGAKAFDISSLNAKYGYALDATKRDKIIIGAPAANDVKISIQGKAAHSGSSPEKGVNALAIAADAITRIPLGRIDEQSTANLGLIKGGTATNIVPELVTLQGEVRSHSPELLEHHTERIADVFRKVTYNWPCEDSLPRPGVTITVKEEFPAMLLDQAEPVLIRIKEGADKIGRELNFDIAGGGSDANIFCGKEFPTAILPTGMSKVHTTDEEIDLEDMVKLTELLLAMVTE